jgi:crossover junction endodeoxyribonuclease RuvC
VGIDQSFNSTGIIILDEAGDIVEQKNFSLAKYKEVEEKLVKFEEEISFIPNIVRLQSVYIEGPSYMSSGQYVLQMGALHFLLRLFLYKRKVSYKVIAPGTLKKFVTGKGNSKKDLMLLKVFKRWGVESEIDDLADAYGLARMALEDFINDNNR